MLVVKCPRCGCVHELLRVRAVVCCPTSRGAFHLISKIIEEEVAGTEILEFVVARGARVSFTREHRTKRSRSKKRRA